jgi:FdhD protein
MLKKTVRMGCPIVVSRTSPTSRSVEAAEMLGVTIVGYARRGSLRVYTHPERLGHPAIRRHA